MQGSAYTAWGTSHLEPTCCQHREVHYLREEVLVQQVAAEGGCAPQGKAGNVCRYFQLSQLGM